MRQNFGFGLRRGELVVQNFRHAAMQKLAPALEQV
jgi:hypothetical protein